MPVPRPMTRNALLSAFAGGPTAHVRYLILTEIDEKEGFPNTAGPSRAIAHARNHYSNLRDLRTDMHVFSGTPVGPDSAFGNF